MDEPVRSFDTGATRDTEQGKLDYEGFFSPAVLKRRAEYMNKHRVQSDGTLRASDNWQKGIPLDVYYKSLKRHEHEAWSLHRADRDDPMFDYLDWSADMEEALCGIMFNAEGYLHELLKEK